MRLFGREIRLKGTTAEAMSQALFWAFGGAPAASGVTVSPETAMRCAAVFACVRVIAESVGQLPLILYRRRKDGGKERATDHPLYRLLHDAPNDWQTSLEFREMMTGHTALRGNAYAFKNIVNGRLRELLPIHPDRVTAHQAADYTLSYVVANPGGGTTPYTREQIFHLPGLSSNGYSGLSIVAAAREAIGLALATEKHGAKLFGNGAHPGGVLSHPKNLSPDAQTRLKDTFARGFSGENALKPMVLEEGMSWTQIGMTSLDSQFLESRKYQRSEIASLFRVPPHMIGDLDKATFSNIEQQSLEFVVHCLMSWIRRWEQRINRDLLTDAEQETYFVEFLLDALLRGDLASRYAAYAVGRQWGWLSANDVRINENMNPVANGDEYLNPMNMIPAGTPLGAYKPDKAPAKAADLGET